MFCGADRCACSCVLCRVFAERVCRGRLRRRERTLSSTCSSRDVGTAAQLAADVARQGADLLAMRRAQMLELFVLQIEVILAAV